jgi:vacuolar-type H+-ATPase subunit I/STV1
MLNLNKEFQKKKQAFFKILKVSLNLNEISKKLDTFNEIEFTDIVKELKKQKITIPKKDIPEYSEIFEEYKKELNNIQSEINKTDSEIDKMVFDLYELTEEEIKLVLNG